MATNLLDDLLDLDQSVEVLGIMNTSNCSKTSTTSANTTYTVHSKLQCETAHSPLPAHSPLTNDILKRYEKDIENSIQHLVDCQQNLANYYKHCLDTKEKNHKNDIASVRAKHKKCEDDLT